MQAVFAPNSQDIVILLAHDASGLQDLKGQTALMIAAGRNKAELLPLLKYEAKIADVKGRTALMIAAASNAVESVQILATVESGMQDN